MAPLSTLDILCNGMARVYEPDKFDVDLKSAIDDALAVAEVQANIEYKLYEILTDGPYVKNDPRTHKAIITLLKTELRSCR